MNKEPKINFSVPTEPTQPQTMETPVAPAPEMSKVMPAKPAPEGQPMAVIENQNDFLAALKTLAEHLTQQQANERKAQQEYLQGQKDRAVHENSVVGHPTQSFCTQMEDIVANHPEQCVTMTYYDALASRYGGVCPITVNGYTITFVKGKTTTFPACLLPEVNNRFRDIMNTSVESAIGATVPGKVYSDNSTIENSVYDAIKNGPYGR